MTKDKTNIEEIIDKKVSEVWGRWGKDWVAKNAGKHGETFYIRNPERIKDLMFRVVWQLVEDGSLTPKDQLQAECEKYLDEFVTWFREPKRGLGCDKCYIQDELELYMKQYKQNFKKEQSELNNNN